MMTGKFSPLKLNLLSSKNLPPKKNLKLSPLSKRLKPQMLSLIERGKADGIISWHPDRLARNSVDGGKIIHFVDRGLIRSLKFPTFWFEPTPQGLFMLNIAFGQ